MSSEPPLVLFPPPTLALRCEDSVWIAAIKRQIAKSGNASLVVVDLAASRQCVASSASTPLLLETPAELSTAMTLVATARRQSPMRLIVALLARPFSTTANADALAIQSRYLREAGASAVLDSPSDVETVRRVVKCVIEQAVSIDPTQTGLPRLPVGWHRPATSL